MYSFADWCRATLPFNDIGKLPDEMARERLDAKRRGTETENVYRFA
jgi:hypothetical protein